jgi:hypothetical protein
MKKLDIGKCYSDALYWAMSNQSKGKDYHITRVQEAVLRKLIHYYFTNKKKSSTNRNITYSNSIIAEHTYMGEETIKKAIPVLTKKGYISTDLHKINIKGEFKYRRTILIQWDEIESILKDIPDLEKQQVGQTLNSSGQEDIVEDLIEEIQSEKVVIDIEYSQKTEGSEVQKEQIEVHSTTEVNSNEIPIESKKNIHKIPKVIITDEKFNWVVKTAENTELTKEYLESLNQESLVKLFYDEDGIWKIDDLNLENKYLIKRWYQGGSMCTLYNLNRDKDSIRVNIDDLMYYLEQLSMGFGDMAPDLYNTFKLNGVPKRPIKDIRKGNAA